MAKQNYKNIWVYIERVGQKVAQVSLELCCEARKLCNTMGENLVAVIVGDLPFEEIEKIRNCGADQILQVTGTGYDSYSNDAWTNAFTVLCRKYLPSAVLVGATADGRDFAPRFAARLHTGCTSDAIELAYDKKSGDIEFIEPAVGGKLMASITVPVLRPQVGTIREGTFKYDPKGKKSNSAVVQENINFPLEEIRSKMLNFVPDKSEGVDISEAEAVVCVGNGISGLDKIAKYKELADLLGGALGCTRPVQERGMLPFKQMIGQSGKSIKPKLYICFGVSGAINHVSGFSGAEVSVAVNSDPNASIFNYCDYGIVGDMDEVCDELISVLRAGKY